MENYTDFVSNTSSNSNITTQYVNTIIVEHLHKEAMPRDESISKVLEIIEEATQIRENVETLHEILNSHNNHMSINENILSSRQSPVVGN